LIFDINNIIDDNCNFKNILNTVHKDIYYFVYYFEIFKNYGIATYFKNYIND
jgi:hypothetical protein